MTLPSFRREHGLEWVLSLSSSLISGILKRIENRFQFWQSQERAVQKKMVGVIERQAFSGQEYEIISSLCIAEGNTKIQSKNHYKFGIANHYLISS